MLNNNFKEIMNCKNIISKLQQLCELLNNANNLNRCPVSHRGSDLTSCKQNGGPGCFY